MRTIIISEEQFRTFKRLCEDAMTDDVPVINATADNTADIPQKGEEIASKVKAEGGDNVKIKITPKTAPSDSLEVTGQGDSTREQFKDAVESANKSGLNKDNVSYSVTLGTDGLPTTNEGKSYSKVQIEELRLKRLQENSIVFTKKTLTEALESSLPTEFSDLANGLDKVTGQAEYHIQMALNEYTNEVKHMFKDLNDAISSVKSMCEKYGVSTKPEVKFSTYYNGMTTNFEITYAIPFESDDMYEDIEFNTYVKSPYIFISVSELNETTLEINISGETPELPLVDRED